MHLIRKVVCPGCGDSVEIAEHSRRDFLKTAAATATGAVTGGLTLFATPRAEAKPTSTSAAERVIKALYDTLTESQKREVCFDWDYRNARGLLRTHVSANWQITKPNIDSDFFTKDQKELVFHVFKRMFNPDWHERLMKQLKDDSAGKPWGAEQAIAIFGKPGDKDKFMFVMTGRHLTCRADGGSTSHVALGGPIFHGHAPTGFNEKVGHPGNVFWHQALIANRVFKILDGKQQEQALVKRRPFEAAVGFRGADGKRPGLPIAEMSRDQKDGVEEILLNLLAPYRKEDVDEVRACLRKMGGFDKCSLAFYQDGDLGNDREWDNWRLEGPSLVWYFRGTPHVHIWINVADDPTLPLNARVI
jgi:hypothetical protein